jgi:shikimate dehydrogenase
MRPPTGRTRLAAVIGDPVRHSLSPRIHNAAFGSLDLDWVYVALPVAAGRGAAAVAAMATLGIDGLSVTMPHKADAAAAVEARTPAVEVLGVCNCVFRRDGSLVGDNTDGDGLVRSLRLDNGVDPTGARVMVVGTGGAACSIIEAVGRAGAAEIVVAGRSAERTGKAAALAEQARPGTLDEVARADVVVNATPVGMSGGPDPGGAPVPAEALLASQVVVDIIYEPRETPLLAAAARRGATTVNGIGMLVHQAAIAFEHWTGAEAPLDVMRRAAVGPVPATGR